MSTSSKPPAARSAPAGAAAPGPPRAEPIGRATATAAKALSRAFADELAKAGGTEPVWLILLALKQNRWRTQQELAAAVGIEGPTLTHHLDGLDRSGLIERSRDPDDRRAVRVELTAAGDEQFGRLREAAVRFDARLRDGISERELERFRRVLARLRENAANEG